MTWRGEVEDGIGWGGLVASKAELREEARQAALEKDAARYRTARQMSPSQWSAAWELHITTGKPFDEIIDNLRAFMPLNAALGGAGAVGRPGAHEG